MEKLNVKRPTFNRLVKLENLQNIEPDVREFLEYHATKNLEEIGLDDTNEFLFGAYYEWVRVNSPMEYR